MTPHRRKTNLLRKVTQGLGIVRIFPGCDIHFRYRWIRRKKSSWDYWSL